MDQKKIGGFIAEIRKEKGLTQVAFADKLGVTNKTVSRWENGNYMPDLSLIPLICEELQISVNEFLSGERLDDEEFRKQADQNVISVLDRERRMLRAKRVSDFLGGGGTGLILSTLYSPVSMMQTAVAVAGAVMILASWFFRARLDHMIFPEPGGPGR